MVNGRASLQDFFVRIDGIDGESKDASYPRWIDAVSWSYRVSQSSSMCYGGGGGVGRALLSSFVFKHRVDRASPFLFQMCASGKHIPSVRLACRKAGSASREYVHIELTDCLLTHVSVAGQDESADVLESIGVSYSGIRVEVAEQSADGSMKPAVTGHWDAKRNCA